MLATIVLVAGSAAWAADATYPAGSHIGIVPLEGMRLSTTFRGFENPDNGTKVIVAEVPADVFATIDAAMKGGGALPTGAAKPESFATASGRKSYLTHEAANDGTVKTERYALVISGEGFSGYVAAEVPQAAAMLYSDQAVRNMLASTTVRGDVPIEEVLSTLPFKVTETAGFKTVRTIPPASLLLSDAEGNSGLGGAPYIVVSLAPVTLPSTDDRPRIARDLVQTIPGIKDVKITSADAIRIAGTPGFEVRLDAKAIENGKDVTIVQWLRFGGGAILRMVGGATREDWPQAFPRFRAVRDGINPQN